MEACRDHKFWAMMRISLKCREHIDGFAHHVGKRREGEPTSLARLAWGGCASFAAKLGSAGGDLDAMCDKLDISSEPVATQPNFREKCRLVAR
eukprot:4988015-Pyramimonas_sp.AAC.1